MTKLNQIGVSRQSNFELLRIICMLLIICGHIIMAHGLGDIGTSSWYIGLIFRSYTCIAVDVFVLISGYFGITLKYKKLIKLNTMVTSYSIIFLIASLAFGIHNFSPRTDWMQFVPILTKQYWFITIYFVLCLLSPYLNMLVERLDKKMYQKLLISSALLFVVLPTVGYVLNFNAITEDAGYGIVNFFFLYLLGRYIRLHFEATYNRNVYLLLSICSMTCLAIFHILYSWLLGFSFNSLISYDTFFCFTGALCLFVYFSKLNFTSKFINTFATTCLAVYVLHINPLCYKFIFNELLHFNSYNGLEYVVILLIAPLFIYIVCSIIEIARVKLFAAIKLR